MLRHARKLNIDLNSDFEETLAKMIISKYAKYYGELKQNEEHIIDELKKEKVKKKMFVVMV